MRFVLVGAGKMVIDLAKLLRSTNGVHLELCISDPDHESAQSNLASFCKESNLAYLASSKLDNSAVVSEIRSVKPDYLLSANNFQIFRGELLSLARRGIINFHNAPLPRYGGLNACSWAIINNEKLHGVSWHLVDSSIDGGPILAQKKFSIRSNDTAIHLITRCIREGIELFRETLPDILRGNAVEKPQNPADRLYYSKKQLPWDGNLPWTESVATISRLSRALNFHPLSNMFYRPRFATAKSQSIYCDTLSVISQPHSYPAGMIVEAKDSSIRVAVTDGFVDLGNLSNVSQVTSKTVLSAKALLLEEEDQLIPPTSLTP